MKDLEINSMQNENILRDELDLVKDKNNKLLKLEATLEVYKNKLKEIPELKAKLTQALRANLEYENLKGEQKIEQDAVEKLQECIKFLKEQLAELRDADTQKEIHIARLESELRESKRQQTQLNEQNEVLQTQIDELKDELNSKTAMKRRSSIQMAGADDAGTAEGQASEMQLL